VVARIVVLNWNGKAFLHRCLTALLPQTAGRAEVVLVGYSYESGKSRPLDEDERAYWGGYL